MKRIIFHVDETLNKDSIHRIISQLIVKICINMEKNPENLAAVDTALISALRTSVNATYSILKDEGKAGYIDLIRKKINEILDSVPHIHNIIERIIQKNES